MKGGDDWTKEGIDCNKESINTKQALNMKQLWKYTNNNQLLWRKVIG